MPILGPNIPNLQAKRDVNGLIRALQSKDLRTRCAALRALGELRDPRALPVLRDWLLAETTTTTEKIEATEALGKLGDATVLDALGVANEQSHAREKCEIEAAIASSDRTHRPGFYVNRIAADEYALRAAIARVLAQLGGARALEKLFQMLALEDGAMVSAAQAVIKEAVATILERGDATSAPLVRAHLKHASADVREQAAHCLSAFPEAESVDALLDVVCDENETFNVRTAAFITLGKIGDARALPRLEELIRSPNQGVAREAKQCLVTIRQRLHLPTFTRF
jgi:HEAT repeat protein